MHNGSHWPLKWKAKEEPIFDECKEIDDLENTYDIIRLRSDHLLYVRD